MSQKTLEQRLSECTNTEQMREVYHSYLSANGIIERERGGRGARVLTPPNTVERVVTKPEDTSQLLQRVVTVGNETRLLTAYSVSGLDILEEGFRKTH